MTYSKLKILAAIASNFIAMVVIFLVSRYATDIAFFISYFAVSLVTYIVILEINKDKVKHDS